MDHTKADTTLNVPGQVIDGALRTAVDKVRPELFTIRKMAPHLAHPSPSETGDFRPSLCSCSCRPLLLFVAPKGQKKGNVSSSTYVLVPSDSLGYADQGQRGSNRGLATN